MRLGKFFGDQAEKEWSEGISLLHALLEPNAISDLLGTVRMVGGGAGGRE